MTTLAQDLRLACRRLRRYPAVSAAAVVTLGLGIGACTAIFSVADAVLLRPLPFADPDELVTLWETHPRQTAGYRVASLAAADVWRRSLSELDDLAVSRPWRPVLSDDEQLVGLEGVKVSTDFFTLLGVEPMIGRTFSPADGRPGAPLVVIISHRLWQLRFGGDEHLVDSRVLLEGAPDQVHAIVVGVLPPDLRIDWPLVHAGAEIFAPITGQEASGHFGQRYSRVVGRLADGVEIETARSHLAAIADHLSEAQPATNGEWGASMERIREQLAAPVRPALTALVAGVGLVFLVGCCNVGILLTSQASTRRRELAVRFALGAGTWRIGRQILTECLLLSLAGGALGLWLAGQVLTLMSAYVDTLPGCQEVAIDRRAFLFALGLALSTVLLLGLTPAIRAAGLELRSTLATLGGRHRPAGNRARHALVAAELALSSLLLVAASILITSFQRLAAMDPGFQPQGVTAMRLRAVGPAGSDTAHRAMLYQQLLEETARIPGVHAAGLINQPPLAGSGMSSQVATSRSPEERLRVELRGVTSDTFDALGVPVIEPSDLSLLDRDGIDRTVAVINRAAARRLWPGADTKVLGRRLMLDWGSGQSHEVIGVVGDVRHPTEPAGVQPTVYLPFRQVPQRAMTLVIRGEPRDEVFGAVRARARSLDSPLVIDRPRKLEQTLAASIAEPRARALLVAVFALTAVLLAAGGTYSVVSLSVEQRRYDSSVRLALGAHPRLLVHGTMLEQLRPAVLGIAVGLVGSLLLARTLSGLHEGVGLRDPRTLLGAAAVMATVAGIASYLAARRLSSADPATALRAE